MSVNRAIGLSTPWPQMSSLAVTSAIGIFNSLYLAIKSIIYKLTLKSTAFSAKFKCCLNSLSISLSTPTPKANAWPSAFCTPVMPLRVSFKLFKPSTDFPLALPRSSSILPWRKCLNNITGLLYWLNNLFAIRPDNSNVNSWFSSTYTIALSVSLICNSFSIIRILLSTAVVCLFFAFLQSLTASWYTGTSWSSSPLFEEGTNNIGETNDLKIIFFCSCVPRRIIALIFGPITQPISFIVGSGSSLL